MKLTDIPGVTPELARELARAGFWTITRLANATVGELVALKGIGPKKAEQFIEQAQTLAATEEAAGVVTVSPAVVDYSIQQADPAEPPPMSVRVRRLWEMRQRGELT